MPLDNISDATVRLKADVPVPEASKPYSRANWQLNIAQQVIDGQPQNGFSLSIIPLRVMASGAVRQAPAEAHIHLGSSSVAGYSPAQAALVEAVWRAVKNVLDEATV